MFLHNYVWFFIKENFHPSCFEFPGLKQIRKLDCCHSNGPNLINTPLDGPRVKQSEFENFRSHIIRCYILYFMRTASLKVIVCSTDKVNFLLEKANECDTLKTIIVIGGPVDGSTLAEADELGIRIHTSEEIEVKINEWDLGVVCLVTWSQPCWMAGTIRSFHFSERIQFREEKSVSKKSKLHTTFPKHPIPEYIL